MTRDQRVEQLLDLILNSGQSAQQVCAEEPELLEEVQERWHHVTQVEAALDALFPRSNDFSNSILFQARPGKLQLEIPGYEVTEVLGHGGMGIVYRGIQSKLDRVVAIKMLRNDRFDGRLFAASLSREARAIAALKHPNIVQVYDVGEVQGCTYFTMEFMDGGTLAEEIDGVPTSAAYAAEIMVKITRAVEAAHRAGIVHRDLKPLNVLMTADGVPKVSDFGIALRAERAGEYMAEERGARIGTPSYMAPEQADERHGAVGPRSDVYALGAILCEMLTGRPPFRAESSAETQRQVLTQDLVAPSRLNARIPRDLETICLKCLEKDASRRYETASALADDLERFCRNEPITARPAGHFERAVKWSRRRPAMATALGAGTFIVSLIIGAAMWAFADRAVTARAVRDDLREAVRLQQAMSWREANAVLDRATIRLGTRGSAELRAQLAHARADADLAARLEAIRMNKSSSSRGVVSLFKQTIEDYAATFRDAGIGEVGDDPPMFAEHVDRSNIRTELIAALDEWARSPVKLEVREWIVLVLAQADHDPTGWRQRARDPATYKDSRTTAELLNDRVVLQEPVSIILRVADELDAVGKDPVPLLMKVQRAHPDDFWANYRLGWFLRQQKRIPESLRFYQAAIALRPDLAPARVVLANAVADAKLPDEALLEYQEARRLDPRLVMAWMNPGIMLANAARYAESEQQYRQGMQACPESADLHWRLADLFMLERRLSDARDEYRAALALDPNSNDANRGLRNALVQLGDREGMRLAFEQLLVVNPRDYMAWDGNAEYWAFIGDDTQFARARQCLIERFVSTTDTRSSELMSRACLLKPCDDEDLKRVTRMLDSALARERANRTFMYPYVRAAKALAEYRCGRFQSAIDLSSDEPDAHPTTLSRLVCAMSHSRLGHDAEARSVLAHVDVFVNWSEQAALEGSERMICQVLRREADSMILPNLQAFLDGRYQPTTNDERIAMTAQCAFTKRYATASRLWLEVCTSDPPREFEILFTATIAMAQAGYGLGADAASASAQERARWREQSLSWMRKVIAIARRPAGEANQAEGVKLLSDWYAASDLAPIRNGDYSAQLPPSERDEWAAIWREIGELVARPKP